MHFVQPQFFCHLLSHLTAITCQHDQLPDTCRPKLCHGLCGLHLYYICNDNMTGIAAINGHMDNCAAAPARNGTDSLLCHQLFVAHSHLAAVYPRQDALTADFLNLADAAAINFAAISLLQAPADGM